MKASSQPFAEAHASKCELATEVLASSGRLRLGVTGWSMLPTVWPGDAFIIERASGGTVSEGNIVLFRRDRRSFIHRVVRKTAEDSAILIRGDAMPQTDPPLLDRDLLGKVIFILRDGKSIQPNKDLSFSSRAVAAFVQRSEIAARVVVGVHGMLQTSPDQKSNDRVVACQS